MSLQSWLNGFWYQRRMPPLWLVPLSCLYSAVSHARRHLYAKGWVKSTRIGRPVIVVGNLSVGGTGKTPLVCWMAARLAERGHKPGVVTRGYGGSAKTARLIEATDDPLVVGDEPLLLARHSGGPVAIGRDRPAAAQLLIERGCDVIVSDDGLQHYALARDCEIVVIDGDRRFGNGWLLPAGPLRESPSRLQQADAIVVNGGRALVQGGLSMRLEAREAVRLVDGERRPLDGFCGEGVHAIAGIGHPERFFNMLRSRGIEVQGRALADHAHLTRDDIAFDDERPVLMTEKDAVKCARFADGRHWFVPVAAAFDTADAAALLTAVDAALQSFQFHVRESIDG